MQEMSWRRQAHATRAEARARMRGLGGYGTLCMLIGLAGLLLARTLIWAHYNGYSPYSRTGSEIEEGKLLLMLGALGFTLLVLTLAQILDWRTVLAGGTAIAAASVVLAVAFVVRNDKPALCADCGLRAFGPGPAVVIASAVLYEVGVMIASIAWIRRRRPQSGHRAGSGLRQMRPQPIVRRRDIARGGETDA